MNIDELIRYAWNNGMSSYHDTKTSKQLKVEEDNFMDSIEDELKKLRVADVIKNEVAVCDCHLSGKVQMCSLPNCHGGIPT